MPIKGNIGGMTGYLRGSPDLLRPQDVGVVGELTDPRFTRVNLKNIPSKQSKISITPIERKGLFKKSPDQIAREQAKQKFEKKQLDNLKKKYYKEFKNNK